MKCHQKNKQTNKLKKKKIERERERERMQERETLLGLCCTWTGHLGSADHPTNPTTKLRLPFPSMYQVPCTMNLPISFQQSQSAGSEKRRHKPKLYFSWLKGCSWYAHTDGEKYLLSQFRQQLITTRKCAGNRSDIQQSLFFHPLEC